MAQPIHDFPVQMEVNPAKTRGGLRQFELLADLDFGKGEILPKGFQWNGASAPVGRQRFLISSSLHDFKYDTIIEMLETHRYNGSVTKAIKKRARRLRKEADEQFRHNVRIYDNNGGFWAWLGYLGVRIGGGLAIYIGCKEYRKNNKQNSIKGVK